MIFYSRSNIPKVIWNKVTSLSCLSPHHLSIPMFVYSKYETNLVGISSQLTSFSKAGIAAEIGRNARVQKDFMRKFKWPCDVANWGEVTGGDVSGSIFFLGGNCPGGNCPGVNCPHEGIVHGELSVGEFFGHRQSIYIRVNSFVHKN